jgi:hypothetical protein
MSKYAWEIIPKPNDDVFVVRGNRRYEIFWGINGWVIKTHRGTWAHNGDCWVSSRLSTPSGLPGAVTREQAILFAETLISSDERANKKC